MLKGLCCQSTVRNQGKRKSTVGFEPFMVTKFNKMLSRDSNQTICQMPTPSPSSGFYQECCWRAQFGINERGRVQLQHRYKWMKGHKKMSRYRIKIKQDLRQQQKQTVTQPQWEPNHGASPEEACHCSLRGWGIGFHSLLKQRPSSPLMFKLSAISSCITWSTYLDVVRRYCCALEAMLQICVVLYHGWQIHVTKTDVLVVSLDPGFNGMARLSSDDLTTLKDNTVHVWHLHTRDIQSKNTGILSIKYTHMHIYENRHHGGNRGFSSIPVWTVRMAFA
jgi:hypothetical protein